MGIAAVVVAMGVAVGAAGWGRGLDGDDLARQRLLDIWAHEGHGTTWISEDLYLIRYPLYLGLGLFGLFGRGQALLSSVFLNVVTAISLVVALLVGGELTRPIQRRTLVGFLLVTAWAPLAWDVAFYSPNGRAIEVGLAVLAIAWLGRAQLAARRPTNLLVTALVLSLLWVSDPFVLYFLAVPAAIVAAVDIVRIAGRRRDMRVLIGVIAVSGVAAWVMRKFVQLFDIVPKPIGTGTRYFVSLGDIPARVNAVLDRLVALLGVSGSDLTGGGFSHVALAWGRLALIAVGIIGAVLTIRRWDRASLLARSMVLAMVVCPILVVALNVVPAPRFVVTRYLIIEPVALAVLGVIAIDRLRGKVGTISIAVTALLVGGVFLFNAHQWWDQRNANPELDALQLASAAKTNGWDRVYGNYFLAIPPDMLVQGGPRWVTVDCKPGQALHLYEWNNDDATLRGYPRTVAVSLERLGCTRADLVRAYGHFTSVVTTAGGHTFLVWDRVGTRLRTLT